MMTLLPCRRKRVASANPMPVPPPVIKIVLPLAFMVALRLLSTYKYRKL
jgi:hypothetical protein